MKTRANTLVTILRGTETNAFADEIDSDVAAYTDVPAAILEAGRRVYLPAEGARRVVRGYTCRVGSGVDLRKDDRIRDQSTGQVYLVTELSDPQPIGGHRPDRVATLSRTT